MMHLNNDRNTGSRQNGTHTYRTQVRVGPNLLWVDVLIEAANSVEANERANALYGAANVRFRPIREP